MNDFNVTHPLLSYTLTQESIQKADFETQKIGIIALAQSYI